MFRGGTKAPAAAEQTIRTQLAKAKVPAERIEEIITESKARWPGWPGTIKEPLPPGTVPPPAGAQPAPPVGGNPFIPTAEEAAQQATAQTARTTGRAKAAEAAQTAYNMVKAAGGTDAAAKEAAKRAAAMTSEGARFPESQ